MNFNDLQNDPFVIKFIQKLARMLGEKYQTDAPTMTADEIYEDQEFFPAFNLQLHNYLNKPAGYVCKSPSGNMVKLLQPYDSTIYTQNPEDLPAQWGFYWSSNPDYATEFIKLATSPYMKGNVCLFEGEIYRSTIDNNVHSPSEYAAGWEKVER